MENAMTNIGKQMNRGNGNPNGNGNFGVLNIAYTFTNTFTSLDREKLRCVLSI